MEGPGRESGWQRYLGGGAVSLLGGGAIAVPVYDIWDDATNLSWSITATLAENALFFLLAGALFYTGVWLVRSGWETDQVTSVARRTLLATVAVAFLIGWAVFLQLMVMDALKPYVIALNGIVVGAATSLAFSMASAQADVNEERADASRKRSQRLELLYRSANDLERATTRAEVYDIASKALGNAFPPPSYRIHVDGEAVVEEGRRAPADGPKETIPVGDRGRIELWGETVERDEILVMELFASHLDVTLQRIERESRLREERDILEFVNRTLQHDLMGDVSLIQARLRMLDRNVTFHEDSHDEHLQLALDRTTEMDEFVQTMRTYMQSVLNENHALEPRPLGPVIEEHVASFRSAHPEVSVRCSDVPEVAVQADDLIDRVFDNLLTNAIDHNDAPSPQITIEAERREDLVTVRVADNGPGIPPARKSSVFEKGEHGIKSDGTGFGLYLVRDVVESYGGDIRVRDNDPQGTVFEFDLPVASAAR